MTAAARKAMPWRCWPLNTLSHGRATRPGSETGAPRTRPSDTPLSGTVTLIRDDSPSSMYTTPMVISASPLTASFAISPDWRSRTLGSGASVSRIVAAEVSTRMVRKASSHLLV